MTPAPALFRNIILRAINAQPDAWTRYDFARIAHRDGHLSDVELGAYQREVVV